MIHESFPLYGLLVTVECLHGLVDCLAYFQASRLSFLVFLFVNFMSGSARKTKLATCQYFAIFSSFRGMSLCDRAASVVRLSVRLSVHPSVCKLFAQIASSTRQMTGSRPNLHTMVPRQACIQGVLKVKVEVKGHVIRAL